MDKKIVITLAIAVVLLFAGVAFLGFNLYQQREANKEMIELAELDKQEMENEYEKFAQQYSEMKTQINNDSLVAQLTQEQMRTQELLEELKRVKSTDAREIARLKKELATVRAVLRTYVIEIDSLNRLNENLMNENNKMRGQFAEATRQIEGLSSEKASLSEKVAIAAQLDATNINMTIKKENGRPAKKLKDCKSIEISFTIAKNVTAPNGLKNIYVRILTPTGNVLSKGATFDYENRQLEYSMKKTVEYAGNAVNVATYWQVEEFLSAGTYNVSLFADGNMIGSRNFTFNK